MPQNSALYGVARIRSAERSLISRERMRRFGEMGANDVLRSLVEGGYGAMPDATLEDTEALIASELEHAAALVREVTTQPDQTDILLMDADVHNLKLLLKLRLTGSRAEAALIKGGVFDERMLKKCVEDGEYDPLPEPFKTALETLEAGLIGARPDPALISTALDGAYIQYAYDNGNDFIKEYFRAFADFTNLAALMRVRALGGDKARLSALLLPEGDISRDALLRGFELPYDAFGRSVCAGPARECQQRGVEAAAKSAHIAALERERDDYLMRLASVGKNDVDTVRPIYGYLLAKRQEARDIRLILTAKRNGLAEDIINERMRVLYGE